MPEEKLNIHQKLLKIADMAGVLRKNKDGFNYKYVTEDEIQAKITAGMQKYSVMLYPSLVPGTLVVMPYHYDKAKTKKVERVNENGKKITEIVDYTVPVNEIIVHAEVLYKWVDAETPTDTVECHWAYIGQMEDASQAFGAGATYGNRYYLMKALQLATTEDDPDNYRSKQKAAENYEDDKKQRELAEALNKAKTAVKDMGTELINKGISKETVMDIVGKHNNGNKNPSSITSVEVCNLVLEDFKKALNEKSKAKATKENK